MALLGMALPRLTMAGIFLLTDWFGRAYETVVWPLLGFLFMPYTTLAYMAAMLHNDRSVSGWWLALVITAAVLDVGHWGGSGNSARRLRR